jgi:4-amino-4-deoxy-L-arabinose transferase-like glycosyltransferase
VAAGQAVLAPLAIALVALLLRLPLLTGGQIDYDEGVYWQSLRALVAGHHLFSEIYSSQPPGFLLLLLPFYSLLGQTLLAARIGVAVFSLSGLFAAYRLGSVLAGRGAGLLAMAVLAADPISLRESVTLQADGPAIALALWSVTLAVESRRGREVTAGRLSLALAAGALLALGVLVKPLAAAAAPPVLLALLTPRAAGRGRARGVVLAVAGGIAVLAVVLLPFSHDWGPMWEQTVGFHLAARGAAVGGLDLYAAETELPLLALALGGLAVSYRHAPRLAALGGIWAASACLMLAVQRPLWPHHLLALAAPAALMSGGLAWPPALRAVEGRVVAGPALVLLTVVLLAAGAGAAALVHQRQVSDDSLRPAVARLQAETAPSQLVITDDQYLAALAGRDTPPQLVDTSLVRVSSGDLSTRSVEAIAERSGTHAFLFSTGRLMQLEDLSSWVRSHYSHRVRLDSQRVLYLS